MVRGARLALVVLCLSRLAAADTNDLVMSRLATRIIDEGRVIGVVGQNLEFRALASQLGVVLAPRLLTPADTLGFGGFQFAVDGSSTVIDDVQSYWRALVSSPDPLGTQGKPHGRGVLRTLGFFARKGLWFPLPSFELGAGVVHVTDSAIWAAQVYGKLGLHEGYHDLPIPSVAIRGAVSRMISQRELDLTVVSFDATISKHFGIGGTWRLDPFLGYGLLLIIPRSDVIEATPDVDPLMPGEENDAINNFVFKDQAAITRHRLFVGAKLQYSIVQLTIEAQYALAGSSVDTQPGATGPCMPGSMTTSCNATDIAAAQGTVSVSAGIDF
jgi:hypothetical protein